MDKKEIFRYILTAIVAVASALLSVFFSSCASTTRVVTRTSTTNGASTSTVSVTTDARQDLEMKVDSSLNLTFPAKIRQSQKLTDMPFLKCIYRHKPKEIADPIGHVAASPTEISSLLLTSFVDDSNAIAIRHSTDSYLLLHQADLENQLGPTALRKFIHSIRVASGASDPIQKSLDQLTDQQLFSVVRNRHIQQPSDVQDALEGIVGDADRFSAAIQYQLERQLEQTSPESEPSTDPAPAPAPVEK